MNATSPTTPAPAPPATSPRAWSAGSLAVVAILGIAAYRFIESRREESRTTKALRELEAAAAAESDEGGF